MYVCTERDSYAFTFLFLILLFTSFAMRSTFGEIHPSTYALGLMNHGLCIRNGTYRCCLGFYRENNACKECPPGTFGFNCSKTCPAGYHGKKCLSTCECGTNEKCDPVEGCIDISFINTVQNCTDVNCGNKELRNKNIAVVSKDADEGDSNNTIMVIIIGVVTLILILLGMLIKINIRSSERGLLGKIYKVLYRRRTSYSEERTTEIPETENNIIDEGVYDDIRLSRMVPDCRTTVECREIQGNTNMQSRYEDSKFLLPSRADRDSVECSRNKKTKSNVYNQLSLRNKLERGECEYDQVTAADECDTFKNEGVCGVGYHFKSLAVCKGGSPESCDLFMANSEHAGSFGLRSTQLDVDTDFGANLYESHIANEACPESTQDTLAQGQYYVLESIEKKQSETREKGNSNTLARIFGKLQHFQLKH